MDDLYVGIIKARNDVSELIRAQAQENLDPACGVVDCLQDACSSLTLAAGWMDNLVERSAGITFQSDSNC